MDDPLDIRRKRLIYRSWHRGTREMDLIMGRFAETHVPGMDAAALDAYERLLSTPDPDVYDWYIGTADAPEGISSTLAAAFLAFKLATV